MATRTVKIGGLDDVKIVKRRGARTIRLSVSSSGAIRVGLPYFMPYAAGILFAKNHMEWILRHQSKNSLRPLTSGSRIAGRYRLELIEDPSAGVPRTRLRGNTIEVKSPWPESDQRTQQKAIAACERALKKEGDRSLPDRLAHLAQEHGFNYSDVRVRKLTSRWGSCSNKKDISLSTFLVQLPQELIDYVIMHELMHTRHLNHSQKYWQDLEKILPATGRLRKQIRQHKPRVEPT